MLKILFLSQSITQGLAYSRSPVNVCQTELCFESIARGNCRRWMCIHMSDQKDRSQRMMVENNHRGTADLPLQGMPQMIENLTQICYVGKGYSRSFMTEKSWDNFR